MEKLCHLAIALICLSASAGQKVGQNRVQDSIHHPSSQGRHTVLSLECCAEVHCQTHFRNNREIATQSSGLLVFKATLVERKRFREWAAVVKRDAPHQQRSLDPCDSCSLQWSFPKKWNICNDRRKRLACIGYGIYNHRGLYRPRNRLSS